MGARTTTMTYGTLSDFLGSESPVREYLSRSATRVARDCEPWRFRSPPW